MDVLRTRLDPQRNSNADPELQRSDRTTNYQPLALWILALVGAFWLAGSGMLARTWADGLLVGAILGLLIPVVVFVARVQREKEREHKSTPSAVPRHSTYFDWEALWGGLIGLGGIALAGFVGLAILVWAWRTLFGTEPPFWN